MIGDEDLAIGGATAVGVALSRRGLARVEQTVEVGAVDSLLQCSID